MLIKSIKIERARTRLSESSDVDGQVALPKMAWNWWIGMGGVSIISLDRKAPDDTFRDHSPPGISNIIRMQIRDLRGCQYIDVLIRPSRCIRIQTIRRTFEAACQVWLGPSYELRLPSRDVMQRGSYMRSFETSKM